MAVDEYDLTTGRPVFKDTGAPDIGVDPTEVGKYAADVGNRIVRANYAALDAYTYKRAGLAGHALDTGQDYIHNGSAWLPTVRTTPWVNLTLSTGWVAVGGHTPRGRLLNGVVYLEGAVQRNTGGFLTSLAVIPEALRILGTKSVFIGGSVALRSGVAAASELITNETGVLSVGAYTAIDGNPNWVVPISGSYVQDQR